MLNELSNYLNHLHELRRISEGNDTVDSPGYPGIRDDDVACLSQVGSQLDRSVTHGAVCGSAWLGVAAVSESARTEVSNLAENDYGLLQISVCKFGNLLDKLYPIGLGVPVEKIEI